MLDGSVQIRLLAPYAKQQRAVWKGTHDHFYEAQQETAVKADARNGVKWKASALRHSCASYGFAETKDACRVAGELVRVGKVRRALRAPAN